jgi:hypothetical protein
LTFRNSVTRFSERAVRAALWLGVDRPVRAAAFLIAALVVAALALAVAAGPTWRLYAYLPPSALRSDRLRITHDLATRWQRETPDVVLLGGSQVREIVPDQEFMARELSVACGRPVRVLNAASSAQLLESSWSIADRFAEREPQPLFVIGPNLWRVTDVPNGAAKLGRALFLLPRAPSLQRAGVEVPLSLPERGQVRAGIAVMDLLTAAGFGGHSPSAGDPFQASQHQYRAPAWSAERKLIDARFQVLESADLPASTVSANVAAYSEFARTLRSRGGSVAFLLTPYAPEARRPLAAWEGELAPAVRSLADIAAVLDLRAMPLESADFYDTVHLMRDGRSKLWPTMQRFLVTHLSGCGG